MMVSSERLTIFVRNWHCDSVFSKKQEVDMDKSFRQRLLTGDRLIGTMISLPSLEVVEIMAGAGFDWFFIDAEHAPFDDLMIQRMLQVAGPETPCLIRVADKDELHIKKALDAGAAGIIAPMVNNAAQAEKVVKWAKYPPLGTRGVGLGRAHGYGLRFGEYVQQANHQVVVVTQIEHIQAVEDIAAIVQVEGIDALLVGPYDLSASMGLMGQVDHPDVVAAIDQVTQVCQGAGMPLGIFGVSAEAVWPYVTSGYSLLIVGADCMLIGKAARELFAQVRKY
jgi:2-dehydro-3-deoxyglucarate aldolase